MGGVIGIILLSFVFKSNQVQAASITPSVTTTSFPAPANLAAVSAGYYQINLSWDAVATAVSYKVYRGGIYIDSSTSTSYSDTGLSSGTTYSYTVTAVNSAGSESGQSNSASATTGSLPTEEEEGGIFIPPPKPKDVFLVINNNEPYTNSRNVILSLSGKNVYQVAISNDPNFKGAVFEYFHPKRNWTLEEGDGEKTVYAKFRNLSGGVSDVISDSIVLDTTPPANISNFDAYSKDSQIALRWNNPKDNDFAGVMITRSETFYPENPYDGFLVYDGRGEYFIDSNLNNGQRYYYTAFSYDEIGNLSSGAIVSAVPTFFEPQVPPEDLPPDQIPPEELPPDKEIPEEEILDEVPEREIPEEIRRLTLDDFDFIQEGEKLNLIRGRLIRVDPEKPLTISIDYEKVPEVLKTIMVTLKKDNKSFSFLLKIDEEKGRYYSIIMPPEPGLYPFNISILDYKNRIFKKLSGQMEVQGSIRAFLKVFYNIYKRIIFYSLLALLILLLIIYIIWRSRRNRKLEREEYF